MKCLISVELPENIRSKLFILARSFKKSGNFYGKIANEKNLNLTLRTFEDISEEALFEIRRVLSRIDFRKFPVETGEIGFFPSKDFVQVIWIELLSRYFEELKETIDVELEKSGFEKDNLEFKAHLTLARVKGVKNKEKFSEAIDTLKADKMFFIVDSFSLIKSRKTKKRTKEEKVEEFVLSMKK